MIAPFPDLCLLVPIWQPYNDTETNNVEKVQRTATRWTCRRWRNRSSVDDMLDELEWPSLEDRRVKSSSTFFYKIHSGTVSLDKDRYLTPALNLRSKGNLMIHNTQDIWPIVMLRKILFFSRTTSYGIVFSLQWSHQRLLSSRLLFRSGVQRYTF